MNILSEIVEVKKQEIAELYRQHDLAAFEKEASGLNKDTPLFYERLADAKKAGRPFFISEFKRKSPSEGWINQHTHLPDQIKAYARAGASAISVLTDSTFFGGNYSDLQLAAATLGSHERERPLLLQKDFILDPIQIHLARRCGADLILLIAAILSAEELAGLKHLAESLGMGVLVEVHDREELKHINHLDFQVLGINNRDLKTFRTALNRVNVLRGDSSERFVISESGIRDAVDFQMVKKADGFLIGTGLMRRSAELQEKKKDQTFSRFFQTEGKMLFKACGIRTPEMLSAPEPDFLGVNFSPLSKRRPDAGFLEQLKQLAVFPAHWVAVFYKNTESEIRQILETFPFQTVQLYANDTSPEFVRSLRKRVLLAVSIRTPEDLNHIPHFAEDIDCFILDGAVPGNGQLIEAEIPADFPYPFLLAGGIHAGNPERVLQFPNCIGVDVASGIEVEGKVEPSAVKQISERLAELSARIVV